MEPVLDLNEGVDPVRAGLAAPASALFPEKVANEAHPEEQFSSQVDGRSASLIGVSPP